MKEYAITNDGFGIHTFELMIPYMEKNEMEAIVTRVYSEPTNDPYYDDKDKCIVVRTDKYPCLRIRLYHNKHKRYIRVIVTANKVLYPKADYLSILNENDDIALLGTMLTDMLTDIFGEEYTLERFSLSRIDCCVNVMLSKDFSAERYVKLISRSLYCRKDMIDKYDEDMDEKNKVRNKHGFRIRTDFGGFTAYDKYFQLEDKKRNFNNISDALLRIELMYKREHIYNTRKANDIENNAETLEFYLHNSRSYFKEFICSRLLKGRYYTVKKMREIVDNSDLEKCEKKHALKHIEAQFNAKHYCGVVKKSKKVLKSESAFYNMLKNFECLDMSPVSLSYRDKHGDNSVPSLYELLGFDE